MSAVSSVFNFLLEAVRLVREWLSGKSEDRKALWSDIESVRTRLAEALAAGRISDAAFLKKELDRLMKQYSRQVARDIGEARSARGGTNGAAMTALAIILFTCQGCISGKSKAKPTGPLVVGERVLVVEPGSTVEVPALSEPASRWYLIDDIGLLQWLGIDGGAK